MMDILEIRKRLPHRYPFLLVDRVVEVTAGESISAYKNISVNEDCFNGHFPDTPIFPGVLIVEAMAQTAGILGFVTEDKTVDDDALYLFVGSDKIRFRRQVVPGDRLDLTAKILTVKRNMWKFECEARVDGALAASGEIICALTKK